MKKKEMMGSLRLYQTSLARNEGEANSTAILKDLEKYEKEPRRSNKLLKTYNRRREDYVNKYFSY